MAGMARDLVATALERWARERGDAPLLFYRDARGQMRWWSARRAAEEIGAGTSGRWRRATVGRSDASELPAHFLAALASEGDVRDPTETQATEVAAPPLDLSLAAAAVAEAVGLPGVGASRDVWICWRPLTVPAERAMALWALGSGATIVVEPSQQLPAWLVAWARPTLWSGDTETLSELLAGIAVEAPRFLTRRWLRQRFERLRAVLVEGDLEGGRALDAVRRALLDLECTSAPRIVPFPRLALASSNAEGKP